MSEHASAGAPLAGRSVADRGEPRRVLTPFVAPERRGPPRRADWATTARVALGPRRGRAETGPACGVRRAVVLNWLLWLVIGGVVGGIASLIVPGRTPGGAVGAVVVGLLGGVLGGWLLNDLLGLGLGAGVLGAVVVGVVGAVIILFVLRATAGRGAAA
jgi:uncharacterized membrane protein YeaQ/YmgE (transglycosylase-associated protein family)